MIVFITYQFAEYIKHGMETFRIFGALRKPNIVFLLLLALFSALGNVLGVVVFHATEYRVVAYILFAVSGVIGLYCLVCFVGLCIRVYRYRLRPKLKACKYTKFLYNYGFRTLLFSLISLLLNVGFAVFNGVNAVRYRSFWFASLTAYYGALILFRVGVALGGKRAYEKYKSGDGEAFRYDCLKIYFGGGVALFVLQGAMVGAVTQMIATSRSMESGFAYPLVTAIYTFWRMGLAIYNIFRARRFNNYVIQALRNINLSNACISMVSLTVLLITVFGDGGMMAWKGAVGFGACAVTILIALTMTVKGAKGMREIKRSK